MGSDIHVHVEVFNPKTGKWEEKDDRGPRPSYEDWDAWDVGVPYIYEDRNYSVFAMLANVRNGSGFAGCDTGNGYLPISMPKGLPEDVSEGTRSEYEDWGESCHTHSWLTVQELLDYDWERVTKRRGIVGTKGYLQFKEQGFPVTFSGGVWGPDVILVSNEEMERILEGGGEHKKSYFTKVEWEEPYKLSASTFFEVTLPALKGLGEPENVRMVFWFDS